MENQDNNQLIPKQPSARRLHGYEWLIVGVFCLKFLSLFGLAILISPWIGWRRAVRLRGYYRRANRLLCWKQAKDRLSSDQGTVIIEILLLDHICQVWWVEGNLREIYPDCPLPSAQIMDPQVDIGERWALLTDDKTKAWWSRHLPEFIQNVHLVETPFAVRRKRDEILGIAGAVAVEQYWASRFNDSTT